MLWMRWRILVNRVRRSGKVGNVLLGLLLVLGALLSMALFVLALILGVEFLPEAKPVAVLAVWFGFAVMFFFMWLVGLVMDLQRSDSMSFKNLLHLPVSLGWVFLYNYIGSFVSISMALFLPAMLGFGCAMVITQGPVMLLCFPLIFTYFAMITAVTYQFRGWLSRLMEDKRRGRNVLALVTFGLVIVTQLPNLISMHYSRNSEEVHLEPHESAHATLEHVKSEKAREKEEIERVLLIGTAVVPIGWLPYGVRAAWDGRWWYGALCVLGMGGIASMSLRRSFRTTLASFLGEERQHTAVTVADVPGADDGVAKRLLVERKLPFTDDRTSGIAMAGLRSLLRSPEGKLLLMGPVILLLVFGTMLYSKELPAEIQTFAPLMTLGATMVGLLSISQLTQNQFGLDREGFRAFVLSPVPRYLILRGKNFSAAPLAIAFGVIALIALTAFVGLSPLHLLGACFQLISTFLILCMLGNLTSILLPMRLKPQGMKAAKPKFSTIMYQMLSIFLIPLVLSPLMVPHGVELLWSWQDLPGGPAVYAVMHALMMIAVYFLYGIVVKRQGEMLQNREQNILDVLTRE